MAGGRRGCRTARLWDVLGSLVEPGGAAGSPPLKPRESLSEPSVLEAPVGLPLTSLGEP